MHPPVFRQYSSIKSEQGFAAPVQGTHYHGFGPAQFSGGNVYPYGYLSHSVPHTSSGIGRVMKPESGHHHQQASSASSTIHRPYFQQQSPAAWGHVGGGFMPSQLAMPAPRQMLQPSYFQYAPVTTAPTDPGSTSTGHTASAPSATSYQAGSSSSPTSSGTGASRGITPEPLVDVHSASSFSFDQPSGPPISMPYSAVDHRHFNPLTHGPPQTAQVPAHFVRIASAPPNLLHFQSLPAVPTISGWDEIGPYHGPGGYGDAHSIGGGRSGEDEEWEYMDDLMGSRETSTSESMEENVAANSAATSVSSRKLPGHWSTPIAYPTPPARPPQESGRYPSSESSSSASSTLVSRSPHDAPFKPLPPTSGFASSTHPMALTPITPCGYYPPPATPVNISWGGHPMRQEVFENSAKMERSIDPARLSGPHRDEQSITLLTPPRLNRQESGPVTAVGLGIAGVSFRDRPEDVIERKESEESTVYPIPIEVEEEIDSDLEMAVDDVSDDDFVPGGSKRKSTKKGKRAKSAFRRASTKVGSK